MKVILISGKSGHGKDTFAGFLKKEMEKRGKTVLIAHYADLLKYICTQFFDWDGKKDEAGRSLLQHIGTGVIRTKDPDFWVRSLGDILELLEGSWDYVLIPDARFPNEIERIKSRFDALHIRVIRMNYKSKLTRKQQQHPSETALDDYEPDIPVWNYSLSELKYTAAAILDAGVL